MFLSKLGSAVVVALWLSSTLCEGVTPPQDVRTDSVREISGNNSRSPRGPSRIEVRNVIVQGNVVVARQAGGSTKQGSSAPVATPKSDPETSKNVAETSKPTAVETTAPKPVEEETTAKPVVAEPTPKPVEAVTTSSPPAVVQAPPTTSSSSPTAAAPDAASTSSKKSSSSSAPNPATTWPVAGDTNRDGLDIYKTRSQSPMTTDRYRISRTIRTNAIAQATEQVQQVKSGAGSVSASRTWRSGLAAGIIAAAAIGL